MDKEEMLIDIAQQFKESSLELNKLSEHLVELTTAITAVNKTKTDILNSVPQLSLTLSNVKEAAAEIEAKGAEIIQQVKDAYPRLDQYQCELNNAASKFQEFTESVNKFNETVIPATERSYHSLTELRTPIESLSGVLAGHMKQVGNFKNIVAESTVVWERVGRQSSDEIKSVIASIENHANEMTVIEKRIDEVKSTFESIHKASREIENGLDEIVIVADRLDLTKYDNLREKVHLLLTHMEDIDKAATKMEDISNLLQRVAAWDFKTEVDSVSEAIESLRIQVEQAREQHKAMRSDYGELRGEITAAMATQIDLKIFLDSLTQSGRDQTAYFEELCNQWASKNLKPKAMKAVTESLIKRILAKLRHD
ncbi:hypothetical protein A2V80_02360 [Candidatus Woesebacteria bacterium RBG_16_39_8b]|uniref:Uncharacterized protein n=1 Tax=Candidatus Woesebacteria bacterium RBG_16_39_8b TaxID=1802482 RepID=A0A1F7XAL1_9BACT|nr:MAG: hypothetical protein A2V80_02360 [Candidatus Woesebacteria bacterium RBG_16_39_8b]